MTFTSLAASPAAHQILYAGGDRGLLKSLDGGLSWSPAGAGLPSPAAVKALVVDPANPALVYAGVNGIAGGGVFASQNGGASWSLLGEGQPATESTALALDSAHHILYAGTNGAGTWALSLP